MTTTNQKDTKHCSDCKQDLPLENFSKNRAKKDGLQNQCKVCNNNRRLGRKEEIAKYMRLYRLRPLQAHKIKFRNAAATARNKGLILVEECAHCEATDDLQIHHLDYSDGQELNVIVLCRHCHKKEHRVGPAILVPARFLTDDH